MPYATIRVQHGIHADGDPQWAPERLAGFSNNQAEWGALRVDLEFEIVFGSLSGEENLGDIVFPEEPVAVVVVTKPFFNEPCIAGGWGQLEIPTQ